MKAIILAAGMGKRLRAAGWDQPKCLLPFGSTTLLDHVLASLLAIDVREVVVVVGYEADAVRAAVARHPVRATFIENPDYATTNTINSLHRAADHLDGDFLYFNADVLFDSGILPGLLMTEGTALSVDQKHCAEEEVKVIVDADGRITKIGKTLDPKDCAGEFIGIAKFAAEVCDDFRAALKHFNEDLGERNLFFEAAVDTLLATHVHRAVPMGDLRAVEIDSPEDLADARALWDSGAIFSAATQGACDDG
jgi:choline kinase